ncbi:hypothetical protein WA026_019674 [Henosepilachna vigintioctopunctata]|uniref:RNase III domain-containing protein n=1 Tax=Henosepilachna vigintioctopunctata TaxID=420089 RepID=A0AAW1UNR7_9CUCU
MEPIRQSSTANKSLLDITRKTRNDKTKKKLEKIVTEFLEEDCDSRLCAVYTASEEDAPNEMVAQTSIHLLNSPDIDHADSPMTVKNRDFIFVEYHINNRKYKYAAHVRHFDEKGEEIRVTFLKISNEDGTLFKINENDMSDGKWEQILTILPVPNIRMKGNRVLGDIFEALAGAIFLDSGYDLEVVWKVFYKIMWREIELFSNNVPKNMVRRLYECEGAFPSFG